ncbi:MAG: hypothetical protein HC815_05970 [Richelia sp. RM1_1_1]|nr:hypothetical protein [Richelia sp. RM1_1_1]
MEPLTANELQAIAMAMYGIKYPDSHRKFILEVYHGIFFKNLADKFQVNNDEIQLKLEKMQTNYPHQFKNIVDKMKIFWDTQTTEAELVIRLSELKLI